MEDYRVGQSNICILLKTIMSSLLSRHSRNLFSVPAWVGRRTGCTTCSTCRPTCSGRAWTRRSTRSAGPSSSPASTNRSRGSSGMEVDRFDSTNLGIVNYDSISLNFFKLHKKGITIDVPLIREEIDSALGQDDAAKAVGMEHYDALNYTRVCTETIRLCSPKRT